MDADLHTALTEALAEALSLHVAALETRLAALEERVVAHVPRKAIRERVKARHRAVLKACHGLCPCCLTARILDDQGRFCGEFDHYFSRERREFTEVWPLCRACHRRMADRTRYAAAFEAYLTRAEQVEAGQLALFG